MYKTNWICCLQKTKQFIGFQSDIFESTDSIYYDEYYETLISVEVCARCKATYASYMAVEFTIPKIYFHIPISFENYNIFYDINIITKEELYNAREGNFILVEREISNNSIWEWQEITKSMWDNI
ncbi:MAG: hypothetical protein U0354_17725 [Candidatus Sericytochromatia bacterium]